MQTLTTPATRRAMLAIALLAILMQPTASASDIFAATEFDLLGRASRLKRVSTASEDTYLGDFSYPAEVLAMTKSGDLFAHPEADTAEESAVKAYLKGQQYASGDQKLFAFVGSEHFQLPTISRVYATLSDIEEQQVEPIAEVIAPPAVPITAAETKLQDNTLAININTDSTEPSSVSDAAPVRPRKSRAQRREEQHNIGMKIVPPLPSVHIKNSHNPFTFSGSKIDLPKPSIFFLPR